MDILTSVVRSGSDIIQAFAFAADKTFESSMLQTGKSAVKFAILISPPATAKAGEGSLDSSSEARARGYAAINRDLNRAFVPVRIKHMRQEAISGAELVAIHQRLLARKRPGAPMRRDRAQPYFVDVRKLKTLQAKLRTSVGKLAAGYLPAARALGASVPAWVARHSSRGGTIEIQTRGSSLYVRASNRVSSHAPSWVVPEMQRRADYAVFYALQGLKRQMPYLLARDAGNAGFRIF